MSRPVIELVGGPQDGQRFTDPPSCPLVEQVLEAHGRYVWDGLPAVLHPDDTAVRRFILVRETK
jgi:hypothetical protein